MNENAGRALSPVSNTRAPQMSFMLCYAMLCQHATHIRRGTQGTSEELRETEVGKIKEGTQKTFPLLSQCGTQPPFWEPPGRF